jgi:hypothetical protein
LFQARFDNEEGLENLCVAETLLLEELQRFLLVFIPSYDLIDRNQDTNANADTVPRHYGSRVLLENTVSAT